MIFAAVATALSSPEKSPVESAWRCSCSIVYRVRVLRPSLTSVFPLPCEALDTDRLGVRRGRVAGRAGARAVSGEGFLRGDDVVWLAVPGPQGVVHQRTAEGERQPPRGSAVGAGLAVDRF